MGHVFKLGTRVLRVDRRELPGRGGRTCTPRVMGCYGIGVERMLAAVIEANHDDNGIIWPTKWRPTTSTSWS